MWDLSKEIEAGMQKEKRRMIMRMLNLGVKDDDISIFTDAPLDLIEKVKSEMNYQEPKENYHYERKTPNFLKDSQFLKSYYEQPNPYVNAPSCQVNLLEMSRYAKKHKKCLVDLSAEEVNNFFI